MDLKGTSNNNVSGDYMLLEATGDSEAFFKGEYACELIHIADDDDDDAQSCSYDESEAGNSAAETELKGWESCLNADGDDDEDEKKAGVYYGNSYCEDDEMQEQCHYKSCVSDDSALDEMEKNRLFWEACLAS